MKIGEEQTQTVETGLASFKDAEERITAEKIENVPMPVVPNPYPGQTPTRVLERWHSIFSNSYTKTSPHSHETVHGFWLLTNTAVVAQALRTFRFLRWKYIEYRIQQATMPQVYGYFVANSKPDKGATSYPREWSFDDTVFIDLSVQNDVIVRVPWRHPDQWCEWYEQFGLAADNAVDLYCGLRFNMGWFGVLDTSSNPSINVVVFARFVGAEASGHVQDSSTFEVEAQSYEKIFDMGVELADAALPGMRVREMAAVGKGLYKTFYGEEVEAESPDNAVDDPDIRNNPLGSMVKSNARYVAGSGTQKMSSRDYSIYALIRKPTCVMESELPTSSTVTALIPYVAVGQYYGRIGFYSQLYRMWKGSIDFALIVFSSPFITARLNVCIRWGTSVPVAVVGNEVVQDVTIKGTTVINFTVPFLSTNEWRPTFWQGDEATVFAESAGIYVKWIQPPAGPGDIPVPQLPYVLYERAGHDFEFRSLVDPCPYYLNPGGVEAQMFISGLFEEGEDFSRPRRVPTFSDTEITVSQISRRWGARQGTDSYSHEPVPRWTDESRTIPPVDFFALTFLYWSGQMQFKVPVSDTGSLGSLWCAHTSSFLGASADGAKYCLKPLDGMTSINPTLTAVLEYTVPFLATVQFLPVYSSTGDGRNTGLIGTNRYHWGSFLHDAYGDPIVNELCYIAGGPDFSFYFEVPPPLRLDYLWPSYGFDALSMKKKGIKPIFAEAVSSRKKARKSQKTASLAREGVTRSMRREKA